MRREGEAAQGVLVVVAAGGASELAPQVLIGIGLSVVVLVGLFSTASALWFEHMAAPWRDHGTNTAAPFGNDDRCHRQ